MNSFSRGLMKTFNRRSGKRCAIKNFSSNLNCKKIFSANVLLALPFHTSRVCFRCEIINYRLEKKSTEKISSSRCKNIFFSFLCSNLFNDLPTFGRFIYHNLHILLTRWIFSLSSYTLIMTFKFLRAHMLRSKEICFFMFVCLNHVTEALNAD